MKYDFSKTLIRSSCIGEIMTDPRSVKDKTAGNLSSTAISYLLKVYAQEKYGRKKDLQTKAINKGKIVEEDGITMVARLDKKILNKNSERINNAFFTGEPDIFEGKTILKAKRVTDIKCSWDLETFLPKLTKFLDRDYWWQGQGYMDLTGASEFEVSYCLVNTPEIIIQQEKRNLFYKMNVPTEENIDYLAACAELERCMTFDDIPLEERRIKFQFNKDKEAIERAHDRVVRSRLWLTQFQKDHLSGNFGKNGEDDGE